MWTEIYARSSVIHYLQRGGESSSCSATKVGMNFEEKREK